MRLRLRLFEWCYPDYSELMQNWLQSVNLFTEQLEKYAESDNDVADILARFCLGRMEEPENSSRNGEIAQGSPSGGSSKMRAGSRCCSATTSVTKKH